jgi:hypothetical protein
MKNSLISVSKFISEGFTVEFNKDGCKVNNARRVVVAEHKGTRTCTFLMWRCVRTRHTLQILWRKVPCFGMKDLAILIWQALRS